MDREQARDTVKGHLEDYLGSKGINTRKPFNCLNPNHADKHPSMSYVRKDRYGNLNYCFCHSCGAKYDIFDLIGIDYGLTDNKDIFKKAYELYNIVIDDSNNKIDAGWKQHKTIKQNAVNEAGYIDYYKKTQAAIKEPAAQNYLKSRGISEEVAQRFLLGYDPNYKTFNTCTDGQNSFAEWRVIIIPTGECSYVVRNIDQPAEPAKKNRYRKKGTNLIFNSKALYEAQQPIFVVEGEIDALSIIEVGGEAIGLGSTSNVNQLISLLQDRTPKGPFILALDIDEEGSKAEEELRKKLEEMHISYSIIDPFVFLGLKDANEALNKDREAFKENIEKAIQEAKKADELQKLENNLIQEAEERQPLDEKEEYFKKYSASNQLKAFRNDIANSDTKCISTGFIQLDRILDGGLYEGLYILGAISGLGKTTFTLQMADQIAAAGTDVLIISLEMGENELIAKSVSRYSFINCYYNKKDTRNAKTARGITTRKRWANYSQEEKEVIEEAFTSYEKAAEHLFIHRGIGNIGIKEVKEIIERHKKATGNVPVIIIDYLQILAPYERRASDKQNTDYAVSELKKISVTYKTPVIAISSFNRENYTAPVGMDCFKESGAIEYSSDVLIGLQYEGMDYKDGEKAEQRKDRLRKLFEENMNKSKKGQDIDIELKILKNRGFTKDEMALSFYPCFNFYEEKLEERKRETPNNEKWI